jgi:hypothetical protein
MKQSNKLQPSIALILLFFATNSMAQVATIEPLEEKKPDIVLYSITGVSFLNYANLRGLLDETNVGYPEIAMNLGAGFYSTFGKVRVGMDFGSTNAASENTQSITKHYGSFFSINLGYHFLEKNGWVVAPVVAYASIRNNVLIENKDYASLSPFPSNSISLTNNINALRFQLSTEKILKNGLFAGLSIGYNYSLAGEQIWQISNENNSILLKDNMSCFYLNLNIGTHLNFAK